jgi:hypothetical protein
MLLDIIDANDPVRVLGSRLRMGLSRLLTGSKRVTPVAGSPNPSGDGALLTTAGAAARLAVPAATLKRWRYTGVGPDFYRLGAHVRYGADQIDAWLEKHRVTT